jgi:hypothetical protein
VAGGESLLIWWLLGVIAFFGLGLPLYCSYMEFQCKKKLFEKIKKTGKTITINRG